MKKRFMQASVVVVSVCLYLLYIQFHGKDSRVNQIENNKIAEQPTTYSLNNIVDVFEKHNIRLKKDKNIDSKSFQMDSVTPHIYTVDNNTKRNLFIYVFNNITERKNVVESYGPYSNYFTSNNYSIFGIYETWNVLILDTLKGPLNGVINNKNSKIEQIVFKDLNHGNVRTYKGETDHWKGTLTLKYYTHFYKDENGIEQINNYGSGEVFVHYKIPTSIKNVKYNYELIVGPISESSEGDGLTLDQSGNFVIGTDDIFLSKEDVPTITLTWNKEKETIQLKAKK